MGVEERLTVASSDQAAALIAFTYTASSRRTRLLAAWLLSNGILAIGIESLNGYDNTVSEIKACFPHDDFITGNITTVNGTCVAVAAQLQDNALHQKQGVRRQVLMIVSLIPVTGSRRTDGGLTM